MTPLTNSYALPEAVVRAVENDPYDRGDCDFTITQLIAPPKPALLLTRLPEAERPVEDVADRLWSLFGQVGHGILERAGADVQNTLTERRIYVMLDGARIGGRFDTCLLSPTGVLDDFKFTSVWAMLNGPKPEWVWQLNSYKWLLEHQLDPYVVERLRIVGLLRDWSVREARRGGRYPERQVMVQDIPIIPEFEVRQYLRTRLIEHGAARDALRAGTLLPACTPEERWTRASKYAVVTPKRKTAVRVFDTEEEATMLAMERDDYRVEFHPGEPVRCLDYCLAGRAGLCDQWNTEKERFTKAAACRAICTTSGSG